MPTNPRPNCAGHLPFTRRHFLFGAPAGASLLKAEEIAGRGAATRNTARAVVFFNLNGGPSHLDTFDPKDGPWNPRDVDLRQSGPFTISNRYLPKLTRHFNDLLVVRSAAGWEAAHERGQFYMQTAHSQNPALAGETPHIGAVIGREKGSPTSLLPPFMSFNQTGLQGARFLGGLFEPMMPPATRNGITTLSHNHFGSVQQSRDRFERRFALLENLDAPLRQAPMNEAMASYAGYYGRARAMMYNDAVDNVFKFSVDDENRYGANGVGRAAIVARNAIRANNGAIFFNITQGGWDLHDIQFSAGTNIYTLTRDLDNAVSALADDLKATGQFNETLIVIMGEFGRTPGPLNSRGGRDHYRNVQSIAMMGGGIRGNRVIGATDSQGAAIVDYGWSGKRPIYPEDITASIYSALGVDWTKSVLDTPSRRRYDFIVGAKDGNFGPVDEFWG